MAVLDREGVDFSKMSYVDTTGRIFRWQGGVYRGIYADAAAQVRELFASGCLDELSRLGLFPRSSITNHEFDGFAFVVEHEVIPFPTYPYEWSFDMLRDAAGMVLRVWEVASRYGWQLKDCHPFNVLFNGAKPMYVDLGSFVPAGNDAAFTLAPEFLGLYWRPLSIWASGDRFLAQRIIASSHETMSSLSWCYYKNPLLRRLSPAVVGRMVRKRDDVFGRCARRFRSGHRWGAVADRFVNFLPGEMVAQDTRFLARKLERLRAPAPMSAWHDYHDEYLEAGVPVSTPRFDRVLDLVRSTRAESVIELGGNRGVLSMLLAATTQVSHVVCTDADTDAINWLYDHLRHHDAVPAGKTVQPVVMNFMIHEMDTATDLRADRFRSDVVMALALTHHVTLAQGFRLDEVLRVIAGYTRRYAMIEFMPLGLWDGQSAPPIPEWYNDDWFRRGFSEFFEIIGVEQLEPNRILYFGELKCR